MTTPWKYTDESDVAITLDDDRYTAGDRARMLDAARRIHHQHCDTEVGRVYLYRLYGEWHVYQRGADIDGVNHGRGETFSAGSDEEARNKALAWLRSLDPLAPRGAA